MTQKTKKEENLDNFEGWEDAPDDGVDFFNEIENPTEKNLNKKKDDKPEGDDKDKEEDIETKEDDFFSESEESSDDDAEGAGDVDEEEEEEEEEEVVTPKVSTVNYLKDKGLIEFELEEDEELTEELAEELIEDKWEEGIDAKVEELFQELPDVVKQINKFVINGGDINEFFNKMSQTSIPEISDDIDLEDEDNQELIIRQMMKLDGDDKEVIDTQIEFLKESDKLKMFSEKKFTKWKKDRDIKTAQIAKQSEADKKKRKEELRKSKSKAVSYLSENEEIGNLKFTKKDKKVLPSYMNDKTIKLENGSAITEMQKELFYDLPKNEEAFMQLAALMKNRNKDGTFNFDSIAKNTKTKVVKEVRENVRRSKVNVPSRSKNKKVSTNKRLADYF